MSVLEKKHDLISFLLFTLALEKHFEGGKIYLSNNMVSLGCRIWDEHV